MTKSVKPTYEDLVKRVAELERYQSELLGSLEALTESEQRFWALFNEARDMIFIHGYTSAKIPGVFLEVNKTACRILGYTKTEMHGLSVSDIVSNLEIDDIPRISKKLRQEESVLFEKIFKTKSGNLFPVEVNARNFFVGSRRYAISIARDISERKKREHERETLIADLEKALAQVKQLSGLLPICTHCKSIRDDKGYWQQIESYFKAHSDVEFSHSVCRKCADKYYREFDLYGDVEDDDTDS